MKLTDIIIWVLFALSLIFISWYIFGNSPTFEQTLMIFILTLLFTISTKLTQFNSNFNNLEKKFHKLEKSFIKLGGDFKEHTKHK